MISGSSESDPSHMSQISFVGWLVGWFLVHSRKWVHQKPTNQLPEYARGGYHSDLSTTTICRSRSCVQCHVLLSDKMSTLLRYFSRKRKHSDGNISTYSDINSGLEDQMDTQVGANQPCQNENEVKKRKHEYKEPWKSSRPWLEIDDNTFIFLLKHNLTIIV